jgi:transposase
MLDALVAGERDPHVLAGLARGVLRNKTEDLRLALAGRFTVHHGQMIGFHLARLDHLDHMIGQVKEKIGHPGIAGTGRRAASGPAGLAAPFAEQIRLLTSIPGIGERVATVIISEIGVDMSRFPSAKHLAAWAGLAPGNNESAGRRRRSRHRKGNTHVQSILIEAALGASRTRTRLGARFHRLHRRFGGKANKTAGKKTAFAVAHTLIKVIWVVLSTGQSYTDLGHDYYTRRVNPQSHTRRLIAQLEAVSGKKIILVDHDDGPPGRHDSSHSDVSDPHHNSEAAA